jgi:hypothetical protein
VGKTGGVSATPKKNYTENMAALIFVVVMGFGLFVGRPAQFLAGHLLARIKGVPIREIDSEVLDKWSLWLCVPVYLSLWFLLEITGLRAILAEQLGFN